MLIIETNRLFFKTKHIWFSSTPFETAGCHSVMFRECKNKVDLEGFIRTEFHTLVIDLTQDIKSIWNNMDKSSCRYAINRAIKDGCSVELSRDFAAFSQIDRNFRRAKKLPSNFTQRKIAREHGTLFIAKWNDETLGGQVYLEDEDNLRWFIGATRRLEVDKVKATLIGNANRLIVWEAMKYANNKGIKEFNLGGYYLGKEKDEEKENINSFKKRFGGKLVTHYNYQKDYSIAFKLVKQAYSYFTG